jgi:hypothetical protein
MQQQWPAGDGFHTAVLPGLDPGIDEPDENVPPIDIELAGDFEQWIPTLGQTRILRNSMPPRIKVRYTLRQNGRTILRAGETISDMNYLMNPFAHLSSDRLVYEKEVLRDWFRERFVAMMPPPT